MVQRLLAVLGTGCDYRTVRCHAKSGQARHALGTRLVADVAPTRLGLDYWLLFDLAVGALVEQRQARMKHYIALLRLLVVCVAAVVVALVLALYGLTR